MPYKARPKPFNAYYNSMHRMVTRLSCPHCNTPMLPKHFENHSLRQHNIDGKTLCVWCRRVSWPPGEKAKHGDHLLTCFRRFLKSFRAPSQRNDNVNPLEDFYDQSMSDSEQSSDYSDSPSPSSSSDPPTTTTEDFDFRPYHLLDMTHEFREKRFFGHQMTRPDPLLHQTLEELLNLPVCPLPEESLPPLPVPFADDNLNLAASCVLFYLKTRNTTHDFFHAMIRRPVEESFRQAMERDCGNSHTLPFSCWCDGGTYAEAEYRQHRHLIIVSTPKDHFDKNVWPRIKLAGRSPKPNYPCKRLKAIKSSSHLVNTIGYLSNRKSRCSFSFEGGTLARDKHFYIYRTLPVDYKPHLYLLWPGGVLELLKQTKFQNVSVALLAEGVLTRNNQGQWTQKIKDFSGGELDRGRVANVARDYVPSTDNRSTPHFLHLDGRRKLYFDRSPENRNLNHWIWMRKQIEGGNLFYDAVGESEWIPRPRDQKILNYHKPLVDRCRELESKIARLEDIIKIQNRERDEKIKTLELQLNEVYTSKEEMRLKMQQLTDQIIRYKDEEIDRLKLEIDRLVYENHVLGQQQNNNNCYSNGES